MPTVQSQFEIFHDAIGLDMENAAVQQKLDALLRELKEKLPKGAPTFTPLQLGSYAIGTGVFPKDGNVGIDVGLIFVGDKTRYPDPVELKQFVRGALESPGRTVQIRRPCITVNFTEGEDVAYHVDLVVYTRDAGGNLYIGSGREDSRIDARLWQDADPQGLAEFINHQFIDEVERAQFHRCVRYLKRWRDERILDGGVSSLVLTLCAVTWFKPKINASGAPNDLEAMSALTNGILGKFSEINHYEGAHERINIHLPVKPYDDLTRRMTKAQMTGFKSALTALHRALVDASGKADPEGAIQILATQFGEDFPSLETH